MATILNNEKSTYGGPYAFYTVSVTTSGRTANSITCQVTVKSHLETDISWQGTGVTITGYIKLNGIEFSIPLKTSTEVWEGTTVYTDTKTVTVTGLSETQASITATFRVDTNDNTSALTTKTCSSLTISYYTAPEQPSAPALADTSGIAVPYIFTNDVWAVSISNIS